MPYTLNGEPLAYGQSFTIGDVGYPANVLDIWTREEVLALPGMAWVGPPEPPAPTVEELCAEVDAERDRRIDGGFTFMGHRFQSGPSDRENVMGAAQLAIAAIGQGAQPGDLRWADPGSDFVWITADNALVPLDAHTTVAMFQAGIAFKSALTFHARALKDAIIAAADPTSVDIQGGWPS